MSWVRVLAAMLLPLLAWLTTWWTIAARTGEWRKSLALSTVAIGVLVGVGTELVSLFNAVSVSGFLALYAAYGAGLLFAWRRLLQSGQRAPAPPWRTLRDPWVAVCALISAVLLLLAVLSPPNNWDSMTYHMARVAHWASRGNVSYYATHIDRQLFTQPWAEYAILHTYVLSGSDMWANLVQWAAMAVTVVLVSLLARNLGLSRRGQLSAAIIVLTLPMGITQSATSQNDYVAAMWIVLLAVLVTERGPLTTGGRGAVLVGTVVGLAMMTKATSYFFIAPLMLWWLVRRVGLKPAMVGKMVLAVAIPALILSAPGFMRNLDTYSRPFGPPLAEFVNDPIGVQATAENLVRHLAVQFGVPSDPANQIVTRTARSAASSIGLDLDRAGSTFPAGHSFAVTFGYREDNSQAFAATALLLIAIPVLLSTRRRKRSPHWSAVGTIFVCAAAGVVLLETYFRWNPWNGRYLLPFFALTAVVSAAALERVPGVLRGVALTALVGSSLLWVFGSDLRPLIRQDSVLVTSRSDQYFAARPELRVPYLDATSYVRSMNPERVGYVGAADDWEYPLWVLLNQGKRDVRLESVEVTNASRRYERPAPDVMICTTQCSPPSDSARWSQRRFGSVSVWKKA